MNIIGVLLLLSFVSSCGKSNSNAGLPEVKKKILPVNGENINGLYMAKFLTMNPGVNGTLPGSATLQRQDDKFYAYIRIFGGAPNAWHQQNVHVGSRCPNAGDDTNGDGYIDIEEGNKVWGEVLLPLDSNIGSQAAGKNVFPIADASGTYFYETVTNFNKMFDDLKSADKNLGDNITKLSPEQGLDFEGKVVVIHGTADTVIYPDTVASSGRYLPHQTLPIACGVFTKVTSIPGSVEPGEEIPGPVGDVEEAPVPEEVPVPETTPTPEYPDTGWDDNTGDYNRDRDRDRDDRWYDRVSDWWRSRWDRDRGNRRHGWGDGIWRGLGF